MAIISSIAIPGSGSSRHDASSVCENASFACFRNPAGETGKLGKSRLSNSNASHAPVRERCTPAINPRRERHFRSHPIAHTFASPNGAEMHVANRSVGEKPNAEEMR
jgi:hypothetical protein